MATSNIAGGFTTDATALKNLKLKYFAAAVLDEMPYIRMAKPYFKDDVKGKKAGMTYKFYVPDPGVAYVDTKNLDITNDNKDVWELPVEVTLTEGHISVALSAWNKLTGIEDFVRDVAETRGRTLGASIEKKVVEQNIYKADSVVVSPTINSGALAKAAARLRAIRSAGKKVGFAHPDTFAALSDILMGKFLPSEIMKKIYGDSVVAHAFGSEWIEENYVPFVTTKATAPALTAMTTAALITSKGVVAGTNLVEGAAFKATVDSKEVKTIDLNGMKTNEQFVFVVHDVNAAGTQGTIQLVGDQIRFMNEADAAGTGAVALSNPTIGCDGVDASGSALTITFTSLLDADSTYAVAQVRDADALEFDTYEFDDVEGAKNSKIKAGEITVQTAEQGSVVTRNSIMRIDVPYMCTLVLTKLSRLVYMKI